MTIFVLLLPAAGHHAHGPAEVSAPEQKAAESVVGPSHEHAHSHEELHAFIGVSLVMGFVFMLLVDQIGSSHLHSGDGQCAKQTLRSIVYALMNFKF